MTEKDFLTNNILSEIIKRPVFMNCQINGIGSSFDPSTYLMRSMLDEDVEVVGSTMDGLQVGKIFDVGDTDILLISKHVQFDQTDEECFQYHPNDPSFLKIKTADISKHIQGEMYGDFLKAHDLRYTAPPFFQRSLLSEITPEYANFPFIKGSNSTKCAVTVTIPYSDIVPENPSLESDAVRLSSMRIWEVEHITLSYLLYSQHENEIDFVREILYPNDKTASSINELKDLVKNAYSLLKKDMRNNMYGLLDSVYFKSTEFQKFFDDCGLNREDPKILHSVVCTPHGGLSNDFVPAIKCQGWPRPAINWLTRERVWPNDYQIKCIMELGYQLVAKSPFRDPDPEHHFLLSFSNNERKLSRFLPSEAKVAYRLLKHFYKCLTEHISDDMKLKTFHLKTALFWVAEGTDKWADDGNHLCNIKKIVSFLKCSLDECNLPGYFVPESNLIQHFDTQIVRSMHRVLDYISLNTVSCVYIAIEKEWNMMKITTPKESIDKLLDPDYLIQFTWEKLIKFSAESIAKVDNYPVDDMMDNMDKLTDMEFYSKDIKDVFVRSDQAVLRKSFIINPEQLNSVWTFRKLIGQMNIDPFNIIRTEIPVDFYRDLEVNYEVGFVEQYPMYDRETDLLVGDFVNAALFQRLKYYGNVHHFICQELLTHINITGTNFENDDTNFVIDFLGRLQLETKCSQEDIEDVLHYLLYFCHYTRLRHNNLSVGRQIVRSMREFFEKSEYLYTVYFNKSLVFPHPTITDPAVVREMVQ